MQDAQAQTGGGHWYQPDEVVIVARVRTVAPSEEQLRTRFHGILRQHASQHVAPDPSTLRSFSFTAPGENRSLVFFFQKLPPGGGHAAVKTAVEALHSQLGALSSADVEVIGAMPHWHMRAHEASIGGSPGSAPRPVYPDQVPGEWRQRFYQPLNPELDLAHAVEAADPVRVAVLDTRIDLEQARRQGEHFRSTAGNYQLLETVVRLRDGHAPDGRYQQEFSDLAHHQPGDAVPSIVGEPPPYPMPDHALFVAGLVHGIAPRSHLSYEPVLDSMGIGDLSLFLLGLQRVLGRKRPHEPQIINLSLGFLPHPARLPAAWFGLPRPNDPAYLHPQEMFDPARDERWVAANRLEVSRTVGLLEAGLSELARYLRLNNCLVVAAVGNDSLERVSAHQGRLQPRLPARFDSVLGVAATARSPHVPAPYSNVGDERELGDHVATFGGTVTEGFQPEDGVVGIYSGTFPFGRPNETGWAFWSGTSFATGIVSGIAANYWAHRRKSEPDVDAATILAGLHAHARDFGPYVPALRTPAIEVQGRWRK